jgi:hypothetical protein
MSWYANCVFNLPVREGVERAHVEAAVSPLTDYFQSCVFASAAPREDHFTWFQFADQQLSVRFRGAVPDEFGKRLLEPVVRALEPLAASPVAITVFDGDAPPRRGTLTPYAPRVSMTLGATSLLPQLAPVHGLIDAALQAAGQLPDTALRAHLLEAVGAFTRLRTTQGWSVEDVSERARDLEPAVELTMEKAHSLLFRMDELTETTDFDSAVFNRCVADGLIANDPAMPDADEWAEICEELGLDSSAVHSEDQVREHTSAYRASRTDSPSAGEHPQ